MFLLLGFYKAALFFAFFESATFAATPDCDEILDGPRSDRAEVLLLPEVGAIGRNTPGLSPSEQRYFEKLSPASWPFEKIDPHQRKGWIRVNPARSKNFLKWVDQQPRLAGALFLTESHVKVLGKKIERRLLKTLIRYPAGTRVRGYTQMPTAHVNRFLERVYHKKFGQSTGQAWSPRAPIEMIRELENGQIELVFEDAADRLKSLLESLPGKPGEVYAYLLSVY